MYRILWTINTAILIFFISFKYYVSLNRYEFSTYGSHFAWGLLIILFTIINIIITLITFPVSFKRFKESLIFKLLLFTNLLVVLLYLYKSIMFYIQS